MIKTWKFVGEAYKGSGGFRDGSQIDKYPREDDEKYSTRKDIAYYANVFESKVDRYCGYLFKKSPIRNLQKNPNVKAFISDVDGRGSHMDIFMDTFAKNAKARGVGVLLMDNVSEIPQDAKTQHETRAFPYIESIKPENITEYKLDIFGRFEYVAFSDVMDESTYGEEKITPITRYFDTTQWIIYKEDEVIDQGEHNLGICPVLYFSEKGEFESLGEFSKLAWLSKRHYNLHSEQDEQLRGNTFSLLAINGRSNDNLEVGSNNALYYQGDKPPSFIAPPEAPLKAYDAKIEALEQLMDRIAYDVTTSKGQESGVSLDIKFQGLNSSLSSFARRLEVFEGSIQSLFCRYLGIENTSTISYSKDFNIIDVQREIETLSMVNGIADIPAYKEKKLTQIIKADLHNLEEEDFNEIISEIEDMGKE